MEHLPSSATDHARTHQLGKKILPGFFLGYVLSEEENLERRHSDC